MATRLDDALVHPVETPFSGPYGGRSPDNVVNWLARDDRDDSRLEQSLAVCSVERDAVVDELASSLEGGLR